MRLWFSMVLLVSTACGSGGDELGIDGAVAVPADAAAIADAALLVDADRVDDAAVVTDGAVILDASRPDASAADASAPDAVPPPDAATMLQDHVHINVSNTCVMTVTPQSYDVQPGQTLQLSYHNHSNDYPVDVWKSYGGGYLDLATGATWNETYVHCTLSSTYTEYADISTACSSFRLNINCL